MNQLTMTRTEDAIAAGNAFLQHERGAVLDGGLAAIRVAEHIATVDERADALLHCVKHPTLSGLYVPLSKHNATSYDEAVAALPGYLVLVPSALIEKATNDLYPAVVSEDGTKSGTLRLHVLKQPYRQQLGYGASVVLSAAGQSETKGIGDHGHKSGDGVEAEHFATLLAAGSDPTVRAAWQGGQHVNHQWRQRGNDSVTSEVSKRLFGSDIPQVTTTITRQQIESGRAMILWHEGMRDDQTGSPEAATKAQALVVIQGLGYEALQNTSPRAIDSVKELIS